MNVYDFDNTIYKKDSAISFYLFVLRRNPFIIFKTLPVQLFGFMKYKLQRISKEEFKSCYFSFVRYIDLVFEVDEFIKKEKCNIAYWYLKHMQNTDVVISASPEFLVAPFMKMLGVENVIASKVDVETGKFLSRNCHGEEKVVRFREKFNGKEIDEFYSDSLSDLPMARLAKEAYIVRGEKLTLWGFDQEKEKLQ